MTSPESAEELMRTEDEADAFLLFNFKSWNKLMMNFKIGNTNDAIMCE
jgi:hypothetical protein